MTSGLDFVWGRIGARFPRRDGKMGLGCVMVSHNLDSLVMQMWRQHLCQRFSPGPTAGPCFPASRLHQDCIKSAPKALGRVSPPLPRRLEDGQLHAVLLLLLRVQSCGAPHTTIPSFAWHGTAPTSARSRRPHRSLDDDVHSRALRHVFVLAPLPPIHWLRRHIAHQTARA
jgi:hypothetical protein